ncbi:unnamed protein product [Cercopithifilaria johnstoni]|uniref:Uncharacterized protein n=1 Tax=Cercopithifilaria johnstoni TaxID=2874296 RepID=A0A8J2Q0S7_9BILA|nr:unnamed protein product [Cercopithifilaria johnstoni]
MLLLFVSRNINDDDDDGDGDDDDDDDEDDALSLRRFTQTSFNFRLNSALPPPVPIVSPPISRRTSLSTNG